MCHNLVRSLAAAVVLGAVAVASTTALAAESLVVEGPVTGTGYHFDHSCLAGSANTVARSEPGVAVETEVERYDSNGSLRIVSRSRFTSALRHQPTFVGYATPQRSGSWVFKERLSGVGDYVEVARSSWECPEYTELPTSVFVPISPTRVLDTRPALATNYSGPKPSAGTTIEITPAMMPDLPDDVVAVSANVGLVASSGRGYVQLLPSGQTPGSSSTVNASEAGENVLNQAVSVTGTGGAVSVFTSDGAHLTLDINGYFVASGGPERAGRAVTVDATRVLDTRLGGGAAVPPSTITTVDLAADSALPRGEASAAIVNIVATRTAGGGGYVQAAAHGALTPGDAAILNTFGVNDSVGAMAIVPVNDGSIDVYNLLGTHLVVDVLGWFTNASAPSSESGRFTPLPPERLFDSRFANPVNWTGALPPDAEPGDIFAIDRSDGARLANTITDIPMAGIDGPGDRPAASSIFANIALVNSRSRGYVQAAALDRLVPGDASHVNAAAAGQNVTNAAIVPFSETDFGAGGHDGISIYTSGGGHLVADVVGFFTI